MIFPILKFKSFESKSHSFRFRSDTMDLYESQAIHTVDSLEPGRIHN